MEPFDAELVDSVLVFERSDKLIWRGRAMLIGAAAMCLVSVLGFVVASFNRVGHFALHSMSTFPMIMAFGLLTGGLTLCRGPRRITVDDDGLDIKNPTESRQVAWASIGWATLSATGLSQQKRLILYDRSGKQLVSLGESFQHFEQLVNIVKSKVADKPGTVGDDIRLRKARRSAVLTAGFATIMIAVSASVAWITYDEQRAKHLLATNAVAGVATVDRLFVAPNGITTRVEYTVTNAAGQTGSRNAEIEPAYHEELTRTNASEIPVLFVPAEPDISRLAHGEVVEDDFTKTPLGGYGLSGLVTLMCLVFYGSAALQWKGWDIHRDSQTGKWSVKGYGESP